MAMPVATNAWSPAITGGGSIRKKLASVGGDTSTVCRCRIQSGGSFVAHKLQLKHLNARNVQQDKVRTAALVKGVQSESLHFRPLLVPGEVSINSFIAHSILDQHKKDK